jgi:hypothetical protein
MVGTAQEGLCPTHRFYDSAISSPARATSCRVATAPPVNISRLPRRFSVSADHKAELDRHFAWFEAKLSPRPAGFVRWLRKPSSRLVRIPLALLLVVGGVLSFLPILGLWMLPLGLLLIAQDVPLLQAPLARMLGWIERKWTERQRAKNAQ